MDSFEILVGKLFEVEGYWLTYNYRINISKEEKRLLGKASMPRPEVDILAYKPSANRLLILECKSYLDSTGISIDDLKTKRKTYGRKSIRIFHDEIFRSVILRNLIEQMTREGLIVGTPKTQIGLVCGKIKGADKSEVEALFRNNEWLLWTPEMVSKKVQALADRSHENNLATYIVKILAAAVDSTV